jgi:hypothetical protein
VYACILLLRVAFKAYFLFSLLCWGLILAAKIGKGHVDIQTNALVKWKGRKVHQKGQTD